MTVIRFCITVENHTLQKLLMMFYECVRKYDASGKLLPEMILVWCVSHKLRAEAYRATLLVRPLSPPFSRRRLRQQCAPQQSLAPERVHSRLLAPLPVQAARARDH